jgi:uncharacterized membrane-anchored protein YhcB (DUF1043 family)
MSAVEFCWQQGENGEVTELTEPQVWAIIGVFAASFFGMIGIVTTSLNRTMNARFEGMNSRFETMDARFDAMQARVDSKFDIISVKLENMDRDIQALSRHVFGTGPH